MQLCLRTLLIAGLTLTFFLSGTAQTTGKKKFPGTQKTEETEKDDKKSKEKSVVEDEEEALEEGGSRLGYGVNLGNLAFAGSALELGLSPNIAYKLDEAFAVGFMMKLNYFYEKYPQHDLKYSAFDLGPTVFARWKPLMKMEGATPFMQGTFIQADYERAYIARPVYDEFGNVELNNNGTAVKTEKKGENYLYVGIGFASGWPFSTFFSFHYNILDDIDLSRTPFDYRIGFTYNY